MTLKTMQSSLRRINRAQMERASKAMATTVLFEGTHLTEALVWASLAAGISPHVLMFRLCRTSGNSYAPLSRRNHKRIAFIVWPRFQNGDATFYLCHFQE